MSDSAKMTKYDMYDDLIRRLSHPKSSPEMDLIASQMDLINERITSQMAVINAKVNNDTEVVRIYKDIEALRTEVLKALSGLQILQSSLSEYEKGLRDELISESDIPTDKEKISELGKKLAQLKRPSFDDIKRSPSPPYNQRILQQQQLLHQRLNYEMQQRKALNDDRA
jgi:hypothetical protein